MYFTATTVYYTDAAGGRGADLGLPNRTDVGLTKGQLGRPRDLDFRRILQ